MRSFQVFFGVVLLIFCMRFGMRIYDHLHSSDPKANSKIKADITIIAILGTASILLLNASRKKDPQK